MPKPKSKNELLEQSSLNYTTLIDLINSYSKDELSKQFTPNKLYKNVRDIVAHLHHWNTMFLDWYAVGMKGEKPDMPAKGFTWQTLPALNNEIWKIYSKEKLNTVLKSFKKSYKSIQNIIECHSDEELFEKKRYHWTGSTSMGAYLVSCSVSHYAWAIKRIKKSLK